MENRDIMVKCVRAVRSCITPEQNVVAKRYCILAMQKVYGHEIFPDISRLAKDLNIEEDK